MYLRNGISKQPPEFDVSCRSASCGKLVTPCLPCPAQDESGAVTGAACKLGWEPGTRSAMHIGRKLSQFGVAHADTAGKPTVHTVAVGQWYNRWGALCFS